MYAVAGRDSRLPLAGRGKNRPAIELKITSRIYPIPLPLSAAATRGNGNTAEHSCRIDFYRYRDPRTWKQGLSAVSMYAVAGRDSRLPLAGRGKNRSGIELKITSRIYRIPLPLSAAVTRRNGPRPAYMETGL